MRHLTRQAYLAKARQTVAKTGLNEPVHAGESAHRTLILARVRFVLLPSTIAND